MGSSKRKADWWRRGAGYLPLALVAFGLLALLYGPLLRFDTLLVRDDLYVIPPLAAISGFSDYWSGIRSGTLFDLNPVRDITFKLNLWMQGWPLLGNFHFWNVGLWALCGFLFFRILLRLRISRFTIHIAVLLFFLHPAFITPVAWVSARKHLLALLFVLAATYIAMAPGGAKRRGTIFFLYLASLLSQPITCLWPLWWSLWLRLGEKRSWKSSLRIPAPLLLPMVACMALNYWYYAGPYQLATRGISKFIDHAPFFDPVFTFSALGRYFFQLVLPVHFSPLEYLRESALHVVGVVIFPLLGLLSWKKLGRASTLLWLSPFVLGLLVVTLRPTWVFASDCYLLWPGVGCLILLAQALDRLQKNMLWFGVAALSLGLALLVFVSIPLARAWLSYPSLVAYAYNVEPTGNVRNMYALSLLEEGRADEALQVAAENLDYVPHGRIVFAQAVMEHRHLPLAEKERLLRHAYCEHLSCAYRLASVLAMQGKFLPAFATMRAFVPMIGSREPHVRNALDNHGVLGAEVVFYCRRAQLGAECEQMDQKIRTQLGNSASDLHFYEQRAKALAGP